MLRITIQHVQDSVRRRTLSVLHARLSCRTASHELGQALLLGRDDLAHELSGYTLLERAISLLEADEVDVMYNMATILHVGTHLGRDPIGAVFWYQRGIERGDDVRAMNGLATLLETGADGVVKNHEQAAMLYSMAAAKNDARAMRRLAVLCQRGPPGVEQNSALAAELFQRAIDAGDVLALRLLANLLVRGYEDVPIDYFRAARLYECAIEESDGEDVISMFQLGSMLFCGVGGMQKDMERGIKLMEPCAYTGDPYSMTCLAAALSLDGTRKDCPLAKDLYSMAALHGNSVAMLGLGVMLAEGAEGVEKDVARAAYWFQRAVDAGRPEALIELARLLEVGKDGVPRDMARAVELYERAAKDENMDAMKWLGTQLMMTERGAQANRVKTAELFRLASDPQRVPSRVPLVR